MKIIIKLLTIQQAKTNLFKIKLSITDSAFINLKIEVK